MPFMESKSHLCFRKIGMYDINSNIIISQFIIEFFGSLLVLDKN